MVSYVYQYIYKIFLYTISIQPHQKEVDTLREELTSKEKEANSLVEQLTDAKTRADTAERQWRQLDVRLMSCKPIMFDSCVYTDRAN